MGLIYVHGLIEVIYNTLIRQYLPIAFPLPSSSLATALRISSLSSQTDKNTMMYCQKSNISTLDRFCKKYVATKLSRSQGLLNAGTQGR